MADVQEIATASVPPQPALVITRGRGRVGKSTLLRWIVDRAANAGRHVVVADGDRNNQTLVTFHPGAERPRSAEDEDMRGWLNDLLNRLSEAREPIALDLGGGDPVLSDYGRDLDIEGFCASVDVAPVALIVLGPGDKDLQHVASIEAAGVFLPARTVVVLNEGLVAQGAMAERAFGQLMQRPEFARLLERGAVPVRMPQLPAMADLMKARIGFHDAVTGGRGAGGTPLGPVQRHMVKTWLAKMETAFAPAAEWLP